MTNFDATVDFETDALELELTAAINSAGLLGETVHVVVRADGPSCELGELYASDEAIPGLVQDDWHVTGHTISQLASRLRELL